MLSLRTTRTSAEGPVSPDGLGSIGYDMTRQRLTGYRDALSAVNLATLMAMVEAGDLTPVVDMTLPLDRIAEAHRRVDSGHKVGSIVVTF